MAGEEAQISSSRDRPIQRMAVRYRGWTKARREKFLAVLADTCNVTLASRACGNVKTTSAYKVRRRDPEFARLWDEALAIGYDRLETLLLQRALEGVNDIDVGALVAASDEKAATDTVDAPTPPAARQPATAARDGLARGDVQLALGLLNRRRDPEVRPRGRKLMTSDEVDALLIGKLDALARKLRRSHDPA